MFYEKFVAKMCSCPECKSQMKEAERREENGSIFIWFECSRPDCRGQWLQRIPATRKVAAG
jgi:hypothetical protein